MYKMEHQANTNLEQSSGCVWIIGAFGVFLGWFFALCAFSTIVPSLFGAAYSGVSSEEYELLTGPLGALFTFFIPGALGFAGTITLVHGGFLLFYLPGRAMGRWLLVTFAGGIVYWLLVWLLLSPWRNNAIMGLAPLLGNVDGTIFAGSPPGSMGASVGVIIGVLSGSALGILQWFVLRRYMLRATWWIVAIILGSTLFTTLFLWLISAVLQGGGWN